MNDSNYSPSLVSALKIARGMALQDKHNTFGVSHLVMAMFAENTGLKEILSSMQKDVGYIMEWFDTHREMYRSSGTFTEEVEPDEELSKVLDESERSKIKLGADSIDSICVDVYKRQICASSERQVFLVFLWHSYRWYRYIACGIRRTTCF